MLSVKISICIITTLIVKVIPVLKKFCGELTSVIENFTKKMLPQSILRIINQLREKLQRRGPTRWARIHLEDYKAFMG